MTVHFISDVHSEATRNFLNFLVFGPFKMSGGIARGGMRGDYLTLQVSGEEVKFRRGDWVVAFGKDSVVKVPQKVGQALMEGLEADKASRDAHGLDLIMNSPFEDNEGHAYQAGVSDMAKFATNENRIF